jgi:hypothetical protein
MPTRIYDASSDIKLHPFAGVFTLGLGLALSTWYVSGIAGAVRRDLHDFPASFHTAPVLTVFFAVLKLCGYVVFGGLFALMVYVPARDLFFKRAISCPLVSLSSIVREKRRSLLQIQLGQFQFRVPDPGDLEASINDSALKGQELQFILGAFNRVLSVEKMP